MRLFSKNPFDLPLSTSRGVKPFFLLWSTILLATGGLLATVAVLQYRWTNEASDAEVLRIGAELESLMMKWHSDLYVEFSAICTAVQVGPDSGARDTWNDYLERYVEWNYALPRQSIPYVYRNPDLVGEIYIWETGRQGQPILFLLNLDKRKIEASSVPPNLVSLLPRLEANSANLPMAMNAWQRHNSSTDQLNQSGLTSTSDSAGSNPIAGWQFDERAPAIVRPIFHRDPGKPLSIEHPVDWIVITMDMNVLEKRVLPMLSARYFGGLDGLDYKVRVIASEPTTRMIYASDPGDQGLGAADSTMSIFGPLPSGQQDWFSQNIRNRNSLRNSQWQSSIGNIWFPVFEYGSQPDSWMLELRHRSGPLQAVIDGVRQKNLMISAFLFLLLAVNITVLTVAGFRAQKFARLQMDFVASVSHELRTPLAGIFSAGENIRDGVVTGRSGLNHYGSLIISQCRQLIKHVDRVMLFASMRSGKDRYYIRPLEVSEILRNVRNDTAALVSEESFIVEEHVEAVVSRVMGDLDAVRGCLENLITNAVKYRRSGRVIRISATREWVSNKGNQVAISVEDHGVGLKSSELEHIFEPFYRCPEAIALQIRGTGLGLCLAKHLAESMGGSLSVISEFGVGSIFTLHLPMPTEAESESSTTSSLINAGEGR
jgi:signal transduction histidine kinase